MTFRSRRIMATAQQPVENLNKTLFNGWVQFFDLTSYKKTTAGTTGARGPIVTPLQDGEGTRVSIVDGQFVTDLTVSADSDTDEYAYRWLLSDGQQGEFNLSWTAPAASGPGSDIIFGDLWPPPTTAPVGTTPVFIGDNVSDLNNDVPYEEQGNKAKPNGYGSLDATGKQPSGEINNDVVQAGQNVSRLANDANYSDRDESFNQQDSLTAAANIGATSLGVNVETSTANWAILSAYTTGAEVVRVTGVSSKTLTTTATTKTHAQNSAVVYLKNVVMRPEYFGAKGDYNPDTDTGTDDGPAFAAMFAAMTGHQQVRLSAARYLIQQTLQTPQMITILGEGLASQLWGKLPGGTGKLLELGNGSNNAQPILKDFAILGRDTPGEYAISAYSITNMEIDLYISGKWTAMLSCQSGGTGISTGGGLQTGRIKLTNRHSNALFDFTYLPPNPDNGVINQGWSNGVVYHVDLANMSGNGLHLIGSYTSAHTCVIGGSLQGITGTALLVEPMAGVNQIRSPLLQGLYCEANGNDIVFRKVVNGTISASLGSVKLEGCKQIYADAKSGAIDVDGDCEQITILSASFDQVPLTNMARDTTVLGWLDYFAPGNVRSFSGVSYKAQNILTNGDARRFTAGGDTQWWGWDRFYVAEKTGVGQTDTTHTNGSPFAALVSRRPGWGTTARYELWSAAELVGMENQIYTVSFKAKTQAGIAYFQSIESTGGDANTYRIGDAQSIAAIPVENGFYQHTFTFRITAAMVTNGCSIDIRVPEDGGTATFVYIAEIMAVWGVHAPRAYERANNTFESITIDHSGRLVGYGSAAPTTGGDPVNSRPWQVGDVIYNTAPAPSGTIGWVCTTAGTPGTWKAWGNIAA